ncbi:hypothetical protein B0T24DRAFT_641594 [Lasiosphaeria ovina]|uniref:Secreted protein n=1 Tax=Lasiosphaeria ovina TaxID=92902 RepID=A0AAE0JT65_9PEZI|nr:hypothetical protein B0T24DRAFT_641594 [Lasiosphaeria ovina]
MRTWEAFSALSLWLMQIWSAQKNSVSSSSHDASRRPRLHSRLLSAVASGRNVLNSCPSISTGTVSSGSPAQYDSATNGNTPPPSGRGRLGFTRHFARGTPWNSVKRSGPLGSAGSGRCACSSRISWCSVSSGWYAPDR